MNIRAAFAAAIAVSALPAPAAQASVTAAGHPTASPEFGITIHSEPIRVGDEVMTAPAPPLK